MTEYALILAAIAVVVYGTYKALGNNIGSFASGVDSTLTNALGLGAKQTTKNPSELIRTMRRSVKLRTSEGNQEIPGMRGQTMVEYALIIASIAVIAWGAYNLMGHDIGSMASGIDSALTNA